MKKSILFSLLGLVLVGTALESCKKGEGDPAISLRSRKARMAGDWKLASGTQTDVQGSTTSTITYNGTTAVDNSGNSENYTGEWKIEKDGTFEGTTNESGTNFSVVTTQTGRWNFAGKIGDFKNKDHAIFFIDKQTVVTTFGSTSNTSTDTYEGDQNQMVVELNTLKNKELVTKTHYKHTDNSGAVSSSDSEMHYEQ